MVDRIEQIKEEAETAIAAATSTDELEELRIRFLGRKAELPNILRGISDLPADERGAVGKAGNEARVRIEHMLGRKRDELDASELGTRLAEDAIEQGGLDLGAP